MVVQGQSRSTERREAMTGLDSMLVPMTDLSTDYAAMYAAVIASPVIVGGLLRAATVGALTGISKEELRLAAEFEGQPGNLHRLSGPIATALRAETAAINWLPIEPVTRVLAERSGADSTVEIEIIALWLESRAGGWILRAQASAQVVRLADGKTLHRMSAAFHTPAQRARPLRDWTAVAAPHLQAELKLAVTDLASNLGQQLHAAIAEASRARIQ
ncbi:MAG: hypothetical protein B9S33_07520 [Pedosphaera sp. Tous-C6FEB]|nr:MAG: hypothetical protein B9S33_07520 [Pedosphaera sp. Tous-C6FEB]